MSLYSKVMPYSNNIIESKSIKNVIYNRKRTLKDYWLNKNPNNKSN